MGEYEKEVARLVQRYEEVPSGDENMEEDDDDSIADPDFTLSSDHIYNSEQELQEAEIVLDNDEMSTDDHDNEQEISRRRKTHFIAKNGTKWEKQCKPRNVRTRQHNSYTHLPGVKQYARSVQLPLESWSKLVDDQMLNDIVTNTNFYIS